MATATEIKAGVNIDIRLKTNPKSIPPPVIADKLDQAVDYTTEVNERISAIQAGTVPADPTTNPADHPGIFSFKATEIGTYIHFLDGTATAIVVSSGDLPTGSQCLLESFDSGASWVKRTESLVDTDAIVLKSDLDKIDIKTSDQLFDKTTPVFPENWITSAGVLESNTGSTTSRFLLDPEETAISVSGLVGYGVTGQKNYRFTDGAGTFIAGTAHQFTSNNVANIFIPPGAVYFEFTYKRPGDSVSAGDTVMVNYGENNLPYQPYSLPQNHINGIDGNPLSVPDGSITVDKTDFISPVRVAPSNQLFNVNDNGVVLSAVVNSNGTIGAPGSNSTYNTTGFIPVDSSISPNISVSRIRFGAFYDINRAFVSDSYISTSVINDTIVIPEGAKYFVASSAYTLTSGIIPWDVLMINYGTTPLPLEPYIASYTEQRLTTEVKIQDSSIQTGVFRRVNETIPHSALDYMSIVSPINIADTMASDVVLGAFIASNGIVGAAFSNNTYNTTGYIPIDHSKGTQLTVSRHRFSAFYDVNHVMVPETYNITSGNNIVLTIPAAAAYVRISCPFTLTESVYKWEVFMVNYGSSALPYVPYFKPYYYADNTKSSEGNEISVFLPSEICVAVGRTIELYNNQVSWCGNINNYSFFWSGIGKCMKRKCSITATLSNIGSYTLILQVFDRSMNLVAQASTTVKIVSNIISVPFTVVPIGDSLSNNKPWYAEVITLSNGNITFVGTRGGLKHEGRSGVRADYYLGNNSYTFDPNGIAGNDGRAQNLNPFWNPNTSAVDFAYYKSNYNQNPGKVMIWLGTNGMSIDPTKNVRDIKSLIDSIRLSSPTIPIFVVFTLFRSDQNGLGLQDSVDGFTASASWKLQEDKKVFNLQVALNEALKLYANLYFIPLSLEHDNEYNFGSVSTPVNPRASQTENLPVESIHPQTQGYMQIADIVFSTLAAHQ